MKFASVLTKKGVIAGCFCAAALAMVGCADGPGTPTGPSANAPGSGLTAAPLSAAPAARSGELHLTKDCPPSTYSGDAGDFCTVTESNLEAIEVGSRIVYSQAADFAAGSLVSDIVVDSPRPGNNIAVGDVVLSFVTRSGEVTVTGGTGKFS